MTVITKYGATLLLVLFISSFCLTFPQYNCAADDLTKPLATTSPIKKNGKKWRIGYLEGGNYSEYHRSMNYTVKGLIALDWIKDKELPSDSTTTGQSLWDYYSKNLDSDYIEFVSDAFYTAGWDREKRETVRQALLSRLNEKKDLDLIIAMGTWAGIDLSQGGHSTPAIVLAVSDAVASGIIRSNNDSGNPFIHARVDPDRYERQVRIFQTIIGFKTLGMIYKDNTEGRSYAAVDKVKKVARERGFKIQTCFLKDSADIAEEEQQLVQCFKNLSTIVDAIYVTGQKALNENTVPEIAAIARESKIPTFSQSGNDEVKKGMLLSISQAGFKYVGNFYAQTIAQILNGSKPGELNQVFEDPSKIAINLSTAEAINFYPTLDVLSSADEIYRDRQQKSEP